MYNQNLTIALPLAATSTGRIYVLKNLSNGDNYISVNFITDNGSTDNKIKKDKIYWLQSDGVNWQQISKE